MPFKKLLILCTALFVFCSCVKKVPVNLPDGSLSGPEESAKLLKQIEQIHRTPDSFRALYYTIIQRGERKERLRQVFVYQSPDKLRFELLPTTSTYNLGVLIADGNRAQFTDSQSGEKTDTDSADQLIYDVLRFRASPQELIQTLLGVIQGKYLKETGNLMYRSANNESAQLFSKDNSYNAVFNPNDLTIREAQILDSEGRTVLLTVSYSEYKNTGGYNIPYHIIINIVADGVIADLKLNHLEINPKLTEKMFEFFD